MLDIATVKRTAEGRWEELITRICAMPAESLNGKNQPCPKCGGIDRFRAFGDFAQTGGVFCNKCHDKQNGDGIATVMWACGLQFPEALKRIAAELGLAADDTDTDLVAETAWSKNTGADDLRDFGAYVSRRNGLPVCRVPMYDANMQKIGDFDISPRVPELLKGKTAPGGRLGLFATRQPTPGQQVLIVEGVKDASALQGIGYFAVGLPTCRMDAAFARFFRGCHCIIVPDRDRAGLSGANETASRLYAVAASIKIAELPADFQETGGADVRDVLKTRDGEKKVMDAIEHAKAWAPAETNGVASQREIKLLTLADAVVEFIQQEDQSSKLLPTGLPDMDEAIGGLLPGEMVIVAGRPSHGKTVVAMQMLDALTLHVPALMISEEMAIQAIAQRTISGLTDRRQEEWQTFRDELEEAAREHFTPRHPCLIVESCGTIENALRAIEKSKTEYQIGVVAVDYVQMLRGSGSGRYEQVSDVSTRLKQAAVQYGVVLLAVCQLNRSVENRSGGGRPNGEQKQTTSLPRMSDLRDSGQLEQDADVILFVEWLHRTSPQAHKPCEYRMMVGKNRNRPTRRSVIDCVFKPERQRLYPSALPSHDASASNARPRYAEFDGFAGDDFQ